MVDTGVESFVLAKQDDKVRIPFLQRRNQTQREVNVFEMEEEPMHPEAAYRIVKDELCLDGNPMLVRSPRHRIR